MTADHFHWNLNSVGCTFEIFHTTGRLRVRLVQKQDHKQRYFSHSILSDAGLQYTQAL